MIWVALAIIFIVVLFFLKNTTTFKNPLNSTLGGQANELIYSRAVIKDLVNKDTDLDGVLDWEENLAGLDPTKKETTPGTPDSVAIEKLSAQDRLASGEKQTNNSPNAENLTETEKFSRELFATITTLNQNGTIDQATIDTLGASLAEKIKNPVVRKVFLISNIKIIKDDSKQAIESYFNTMNSIQAKYPIKESVTSILQKFVADENNPDTKVLIKLDGAINQTQNIINGILKVSVPQSLAPLHLDLLNAGERLMENISDMKLFDSDPIVAIGAMSKYAENMISSQSALKALASAISKKLNN